MHCHKLSVLFSIALLWFLPSHGQIDYKPVKDNYYKSISFEKNHYSVGFASVLHFSSADSETGSTFKPITIPGLRVQGRYIINITHYLGFESGLDLGFEMTAFKTKVSNNSETVFNTTPYVNIPVMITPRWVISPRHFVALSAGINMSFYSSYTGNVYHENGESLGQETNIQYTYHKKNPYLGGRIGLQYGKTVMKGGYLLFLLEYTTGRKDIMTAEYIVTTDNAVTTKGEIHTSSQHLSLGLSYIFAKKPKPVISENLDRITEL